MTYVPDSPPLLDCIGVALEAACDALMTLQSIEVPRGTPENRRGEWAVERAISHLRHAIDELRDAQGPGQTGLALGFVLARDERKSADYGKPGQSSPRRTA